MNNLSIGRLIVYKDIFYEPASTLEEYLFGISRATALNIAAYFLGYSNNSSKYQDYYTLLSTIFCKENEVIANEIYQRLNHISEGSGAKLVIINPKACLVLFEVAFKKCNNQETKNKAEIEISIFKAILLINAQITQAENTAIATCLDSPPLLRAASMAVAQMYPYSELTNYDPVEVLSTQIIKSIYLFRFLSEQEKLNYLLEDFLSYYDADDYNDFLKKLFPLAITLITSIKESHTDINVNRDEDFGRNCKFIDSLALNDKNVLSDYDFITIRSFPIYKVEEGKYRIILRLFAAELFHKGVYFKIVELNHKSLQSNKVLNFRALYGEDFSEKYLFYNIMQSIYNNRYKELSGEAIKAHGIEGGPDYYIRKGNKVFVFESKDFLLTAQVKHSYDFLIYNQEFRKRLYGYEKNGKMVKKAILQLIVNIRRLLDKCFLVDSDYKVNSIKIYPIIFLHDRQYNLPGLNTIINKWFEEELNNLKELGYNISSVRQVTLMDIDTLIFYQDYFRDRKLILEDLLEGYFTTLKFNFKKKYKSEKHMSDTWYRMILPFSSYLTDIAIKNGLRKPPKMLFDEGLSFLGS